MSDVFVSYKAEDRRRVRLLVEALQADGFSVWWDEQIGGGAAWRHAIETELNAAKCVVVVWSKHSVGPEGMFVQDEATRAQQRHVYVPVTIDKVHLPLGFGETQALPLTGWRGSRSDPRYRAVLAAVRRNVGGEDDPITSDLPTASVDRRTLIVGGTVAAVAVAGVGGWALFGSDPASASRSIAVLPFANLSGDPTQAYFSDGIAEEIRSALARLGGLTVIGRTSSEAVRNDDAQTIARKLNVRNILTGSVRQSPSMIRITAELIDGRTGADRWSQHYDRNPGDAIRIQTDIAENVARALNAELGSIARAAITIGGTQNPRAQRLLLQAVEAARDLRKDGLERAFTLLDAAIALDHDYAEAYARKGFYLAYYAGNHANTVQALRAYRSDALHTAETAIRLAPSLGSAHEALAQYYINILDVAQAGREYQRAAELAPSDAGAISNYAMFLVRFGQPAYALRLADKALALDPLDPDAHRRRFLVLFHNGRYADALAFANHLQSNSPELFGWPEHAGMAAAFVGDLDQAERYFDRVPPEDYHRQVGRADVAIRRGRKGDAEAEIATLRRLYGDTVNYQFAQIYAQLGDKNRAFAALDRAWLFRDGGLAWIRVDPHFNPIRSDPRYAALLRKMNFPA